MNDSRFDDLVGRLLDDELTPEGWSELLGLVRDDPALLRELRDQLEAAELLALSEDVLRGSPLFLEATRSRLADDGFVSGVRAAIAGGPAGRRGARSPRWAWVVAASAAAAVLTAVALWPPGKIEVARVTGLNGSLQWIGDGGRVERDLKVGTAVGGGTLEAMSADSWVSLEFRDGSAVTVSGPTMLTLSEDDRKELHLREGSLFAKVARQAKGRPMLIHTRTAKLEVLGTQLDVEAEPGTTRLCVNEGRVRVTRLVDGSVAEVPARHQVVASADRTEALTPTRRAGAVNRWRSRLTASVGKSLPPEGDLPARLLAMPIIINRPKVGTFAVYVAGFGVAQADSPPVRLESGSRFHIRGRLGTARALGFGVTMKRSGGSFGGKFEAIVPAREFAAGGGAFDLDLDPGALRPLQPGASGTPIGDEIEDCYVFTVNVDAGLEVAEVELLPPGPPAARPERDADRKPASCCCKPHVPSGRRSAVMRNRNAVLAVLTLAILALGGRAGPQGAASEADWPTYNHDPAGWRFNPAETTLGPKNVGTLVERWRFPAEGKEAIGVVHATPAVVAGEVYFGTANFPAFYKLAPDGKLLWVYRNLARPSVLPPNDGAPVTDKLRGAASAGGIFASALVAGDAVYFADVGGWMYCLDARDGAERWKVDTRAASFPGAHWNNVLMASPILADGKVVFGGGTLEQVFAGTPGYAGSTGRGFLVAVEPATGKVVWKYDVGPKPEKLDPPVVVEEPWGKHTFAFGPATSSVWCTPSYDPESNTLFFGTDVNTAPRRPTPDNPAFHTADSCAVVALDAATGKRKWNTQLNPGDAWTNAMCGYDPKTGLYKDQSIGDTPKVLTVGVGGAATKVVGVGCKNGGFYLLRADDGKVVRHTPLYTGPPTEPPAAHDPRVLALPSEIGGLQSGCATDGRTVFTNGIDCLRLASQANPRAPGQVPTGGRVTATSVDLSVERWRHERPRIPEMGGTPGKPMHRNVGDVVASGIAVGNGVAYFTAVGSGKLVALDVATGAVLKEIDLGPVFAGPSLSRGRVYVGGGNTLWTPGEYECYFPKKYTGSVRCFGLPGEDEAETEGIGRGRK